MKAYYNYKRNVPHCAILLLIIVFATGCSSTKYIADDQAIVKSVKIDSIDHDFEEEAYNYIQKDIRPASKIGINVLIYNAFNTKDGKYKTSNIKPLGTRPPILDSTLVEISRNQIEKFLKSKGFFKATVDAEIAIKHKRAKIRFNADPGPVFKFNELSNEIPDKTVRDLYLQNKEAITHLHQGARYDDDSLALERENIYRLMQERAYFDFSRQYVEFEVDSNLNSSKANVLLSISNPSDSLGHKKYRIGETNVVIAPNSDGFPDTIPLNSRVFREVRYTDLSGKFRRNPIIRYNFLHAPEGFDIRNEELTYNRMYELNVFKNVKIEYRKPADSSNVVEPVVYLIPQKMMANRVEGEIPFNGGTVGFTLSNTYSNNNFFRGAERFEFQIKGGLQSRIGSGASSGLFGDIYQRDFSVSSNLSVPRLMLPFINARPGRRGGMPHTIFSGSYVYSEQGNFFRRHLFLTSMTYEFVESKSKIHSVTPLNFEYRFGNVDFSKVDTADALSNFYNITLLTRKGLTLGLKYAFTMNGDKLLTNTDFIYLRAGIETAGNSLQLASAISGRHHDPENEDYGKFLGLPYNQYVRPELDLRWYKQIKGERKLVTRLNAGLGFAYGNSIEMPFEKLFYAGGSSGVRAWRANTLGPGNYTRSEHLLSDTLRTALYGIDQLGEMRLEANLEYRFNVFNRFFGAKLKGAVFLDAGNTWNISDKTTFSETQFDFSKLGKQIAIGTGMGFRYDVEYFVFRFDIGLKIKDPQFDGAEQWVIRKFLNGGKDFRAAYNEANSPDTYRFVQYNFGIGLPF